MESEYPDPNLVNRLEEYPDLPDMDEYPELPDQNVKIMNNNWFEEPRVVDFFHL